MSRKTIAIVVLSVIALPSVSWVLYKTAFSSDKTQDGQKDVAGTVNKPTSPPSPPNEDHEALRLKQQIEKERKNLETERVRDNLKEELTALQKEREELKPKGQKPATPPAPTPKKEEEKEKPAVPASADNPSSKDSVRRIPVPTQKDMTEEHPRPKVSWIPGSEMPGLPQLGSVPVSETERKTEKERRDKDVIARMSRKEAIVEEEVEALRKTNDYLRLSLIIFRQRFQKATQAEKKSVPTEWQKILLKDEEDFRAWLHERNMDFAGNQFDYELLRSLQIDALMAYQKTRSSGRLP